MRRVPAPLSSRADDEFGDQLAIKADILAVLKEAENSIISIKAVAARMETHYQAVKSWFYTAGKKGGTHKSCTWTVPLQHSTAPRKCSGTPAVTF